MKSKEELNALKEEVENVRRKLRELTEEELAQVYGGNSSNTDKTEMRCTNCKKVVYWNGNFMSGRYDCSRCGGIQSVYGYMYYPNGI